MSHIVQVETQVRDPAAIQAACQRLHLHQPIYGEAQLFSGKRTGWQVQLPDWRYPVVCNTGSGTIHFDNFNNRWGERRRLDEFMQAYAIEKTLLEARKSGNTCAEQKLENGSIKLTINVGGALEDH